MSRIAEPPTAAATPTNIAGSTGTPGPSALVIPIAAYSPTLKASSSTHNGSSRAMKRSRSIPISAATIAVGRSQRNRELCDTHRAAEVRIYGDVESWGSAVANAEILLAVLASSSASGFRGLPTGKPSAESAALTAGMNGADMIASISG
jgi:hypothetical protein